MKEKLGVIMKDLRKEIFEEKALWKNTKKDLGNKQLIDKYNIIWSEEKEKQFILYRRKRKMKVEWIRHKFGRSDYIPDEYKNVCVADQPITDDFKSEPECYGGVDITASERKMLSTNPKYTVLSLY